jgi:hypothetical protein
MLNFVILIAIIPKKLERTNLLNELNIRILDIFDWRMDYRLPMPQNWQDFESICHRLWIEIWNDPSAKKNGRQGQPQCGVDIFGKPIYNNMYSGIQCKDKNFQLGSLLEENELIEECNKAIQFRPKLESFILATTSLRDVNIQKQARLLTNNRKFPFSVDIWSWDDIQGEIIYRPSILEHFFKGIHIQEQDKIQIKLNRFSSKDQCAAFFSRPMIDQTINDQLKSYLIGLSYELNDNSFRHGHASEFSINMEGNKIQFIDNGIEFNLLEKMDPSKANYANYIGTFVLHDFLRKFDGYVTAAYRRQTINGSERNIMEFKIAGTAELKEDFIEIEVDIAGARSEAARLAESITLTDQIKEIIWNMTGGYGYALSFSVEFIHILLLRMNANQRLLLYVPRNEMYLQLKDWIKDDRLEVRIR